MNNRHKKRRIVQLIVSVLVLVMALSMNAGADELFRKQGGESNAETVFLTAPFYDGLIKNTDDAQTAVDSLKEQLGGDQNTELVLYDVISNEDGYVYYSFQQASGGLQVYGMNAKLIVNPEGKALGAISTLTRDVTVPEDASWDITEEDAEKIVQEKVQEQNLTVIPESTEQTLLSLYGGTYFVWVVYTDNYDTEVERSYMAHYVKGNGEYLGCVPVTQPGDTDSMNGAISTYAFQNMKSDTWTGTVKTVKGDTKEITVPIMTDPATGISYLGDAERKIICADWPSYKPGETANFRSSEDGAWIDAELLTYATFIQVYDFYDSIGWHGPDGEGTPVLLLMNVVDENGQPEDYASYAYKENGFQVFNFNDGFGDGECIDVIAHEFTHCVTNAAMILALYENDYGAINEGCSDIMGNLVEMMSGGDPEGYWVFGENQLNGAYRSMKDPHVYSQPEYVWDLYYLPNAPIATESNDCGGVHRNSSFMNLLSYKLDQAGMKPEDQFYYWLNVFMAMTPQCDYPMLSHLLPWMLETLGYADYVPAMKEGIEQTRIAVITMPESPAAGTGMIRFELPETKIPDKYDTELVFMSMDNDENSWYTWPDARNGLCAADLKPGPYMVFFQLSEKTEDGEVFLLVSTDEGWIRAENIDSIPEEYHAHMFYELHEGEVIEIKTDGLEALLLK